MNKLTIAIYCLCIFILSRWKGWAPKRNCTIECELGRIWTLTDAFKKLTGEQTHVLFVRINPDNYDGLSNVSLDNRIQFISDRINWLLQMEDDELEQFYSSIPYIGHYFYHSKCHFQIKAATKSEYIFSENLRNTPWTLRKSYIYK